jgi:asparagine synthase (glutamine-hydrolysing)
MCGIWFVINQADPNKCHKDLWERGVNTLAARGPEGSKWADFTDSTWCFTRLAINGLNDAGMQPFTDKTKSLRWMCNGEIYNAKMLEEDVGQESPSGSDCEVLGPLFKHVDRNPVEFARALDGVFALVIREESVGVATYTVARDPYGVRPLFYMKQYDGTFYFASERKSLEGFATHDDMILEFPPGEVWTIRITYDNVYMSKNKYHDIPWIKQSVDIPKKFLADALISAVDKRLMTERPVAALLSGGLDSSLIAALVQKRLREAGAPPLKTFSIGMAGGTDLAYARKVADFIGSEHHEVVVTADDMFNAIPNVIKAIESYDITTVRASVGNWLVAKAIREKTDCKVVFNGDGSDELFGSYLYFFRAPSNSAFETESRRLLRDIHKYDVLRSDRSISSHGLEARTPFLDKQFVAAAMSYSTVERRPSANRMEKQLIRDAFADMCLLPEDVLYRRKEAFSDGVSSQEKSWFEIIQEKIVENNCVPSDWQAIAYAKNYWPSPPSAEAFYYRELFDKNYKHSGKLWDYWMPKWSPETSDPSARTLGPASHVK